MKIIAACARYYGAMGGFDYKNMSKGHQKALHKQSAKQAISLLGKTP